METDSTLIFNMAIDEVQKIGFESLGTVILQIIITSAGLLTFTVTFADKLKNFGKKTSIFWLIMSWCFLVLSIVVGFFAYYRYIGGLLKNDISIIENSLNFTSAQFFLFAMAITSILIFTVNSTIQFVPLIKGWIRKKKKSPSKSKSDDKKENPK